MATPIGHALAGLAIYGFVGSPKVGNPIILSLACIFAGLAPDLDVIPGIVAGKPALYHNEISHSLGFAVAVSLAIAAIYKLLRQSFLQVFALCFLSYSSHLLIDWLGPDKRFPFGIPAFWPVSGEYFNSPVTLFLGMRHSAVTDASIGEWISGIFSLYNIGAIAVEVVWTVPLIYGGLWLRKHRGFLKPWPFRGM